MNEQPKRRWTIKVEIGADTREAAVSQLVHYLSHMRAGGGECVSGGYSVGGFFKIEENPEMDHDKYADLVERWCEENPTPPTPEAVPR